MAEVTPADRDRFYAINMRAAAVLLRALLPQLRQAGWGRVVNVTTSYRSMLSVLPYGPTKAALEAMSAVWAVELAPLGIGVAVLIPGGPTDTPFVPDIGMDRAKMLRPAIMGPPIRWLLSNASDGFLGRIIAARWDPALPPEEARAKSSRPIGWPELTADAVWGTP
jgi:NAD(P)-dependent dehydrogenase (short-subunit alcohol dehydrogenase family)